MLNKKKKIVAEVLDRMRGNIIIVRAESGVLVKLSVTATIGPFTWT
jgi:hypothetical protein